MSKKQMNIQKITPDTQIVRYELPQFTELLQQKLTMLYCDLAAINASGQCTNGPATRLIINGIVNLMVVHMQEFDKIYRAIQLRPAVEVNWNEIMPIFEHVTEVRTKATNFLAAGTDESQKALIDFIRANNEFFNRLQAEIMSGDLIHKRGRPEVAGDILTREYQKRVDGGMDKREAIKEIKEMLEAKRYPSRQESRALKMLMDSRDPVDTLDTRIRRKNSDKTILSESRE